MPKNVLIVGMPRSGTSMTTNIFVRQGYHVAQDNQSDLRPGDKHNPAGYFEAQPLIEANVEVFKRSDFNHHNTWLFDEINSEQVSKIQKIKMIAEHQALVNQYEMHAPWVWKDPRLCYTLPYWWSYLNKDTTRVLLLRREPEEIYQSFLGLKWRVPSEESRADVYQREIDHIDAAKAALEKFDIPFVEVNYRDFEKDPEQVLTKLNAVFDLNLQKQDLGYNNNLNHNGIRGKIRLIFVRLSELRLYKEVKATLKNIMPDFILDRYKAHRTKSR